jgi:hypothetical protein
VMTMFIAVGRGSKGIGSRFSTALSRRLSRHGSDPIGLLLRIEYVTATQSPMPSSYEDRDPSSATRVARSRTETRVVVRSLPPYLPDRSAATRNPKLRLAVDGLAAPREAERQSTVGLVHAPPRKMRIFPEEGP